jgi:hypothetical protein
MSPPVETRLSVVVEIELSLLETEFDDAMYLRAANELVMGSFTTDRLEPLAKLERIQAIRVNRRVDHQRGA